MKPGPVSKLCILCIILASILFSAGCTQPAPAVTPTVTPTAPPTTAAPTTPPSTTGAAPAPPVPTNATADLQALKDHVKTLSANFAGQVDTKNLSAAIKQGENSTAFAIVRAKLKAMKATDPEIAFVYTIEQQNGTARFLIDADYGLPNGSAFLEPYTDAPDELKKPINEPISVEPYTDHWGTFVSGYAPVNMTPDATVVVIGVDYRV